MARRRQARLFIQLEGLSDESTIRTLAAGEQTVVTIDAGFVELIAFKQHPIRVIIRVERLGLPRKRYVRRH